MMEHQCCFKHKQELNGIIYCSTDFQNFEYHKRLFIWNLLRNFIATNGEHDFFEK